jgi:DUF438 domain-containing protein
MSEYINNSVVRKETLKRVLQQLHAGKTVDEVKDEFGSLARQASSSEIAEIEQQLIDEGLPAEEIQRLCDVHVAFFREGLEGEVPPETLAGHPIHTFRTENQALIRVLDEMAQTVQLAAKNSDDTLWTTLQHQTDLLTKFQVHYLRKENLLFPYLEHYGFQGPSKVMWGIHDSIRQATKEFERLMTGDREQAMRHVEDRFNRVAKPMREMAYKEEKILFPAGLEHLTQADWAAVRAQEDDFGFFVVYPGREWQPRQSSAVEPPKPVAAQDGLLPLSTGELSLEQINLMLTHLPVDVTFVDETDSVRYFSQTRERIFDRTPAIIGRKVQNCHPPQSVGRMQHILDDFRAGLRDRAEFWIQLGPRMVHIRYFAMRDSQGHYRGTLEVTQDITPIRALEGERRLLDE